MGVSVALFVGSFVYFIINASAKEHGIVGFGISFYQELCCQACHDSLSSLYLNCTTFTESGDTSMEMNTDMKIMGTTSDECYASNVPWLQTMAYCIQQRCDAEGYGAKKQAKCFSKLAVAGALEPTLQNSLPTAAPTAELLEDAMWLNVTSLVNSNVYYNTRGSLKEFARSEYIHTRYSYVPLFCVTSAILDFLSEHETHGQFLV